jgi:hypothetical protein
MRTWQDDFGRTIHLSDVSSLFPMCWFRQDGSSRVIRRALWESVTVWNLISVWVPCVLSFVLFLHALRFVYPPYRFWMCMFAGSSALFGVKSIIFAEYYLSDRRWVFRWRVSMLKSGLCPACAFVLQTSLPATCSECGCAWTLTGAPQRR